MNIRLKHKWVPIETDPGSPYHFPQSPSSYLAATWNQRPAVYRWNVYEREPGDLLRLYIGQTEDLKRRINHYLKPGPSQRTNQRLHEEFSVMANNGQKIALEVLEFEPFELGGVSISANDLQAPSARRFLEALFETYYKKSGWQLLNS